jgi:enamine deaminase RidA (YjgF/YER057c/UK114 family)
MSAARYGSGGPFEAAIGYSRVVVHGELAWTAGCTATVDGVVVGHGDVHAQTLTAFGIGLAALERAGFGIGDVVQTRMYVVDLPSCSADVGRAHGEIFADVRPAATMVGVAALIDPRMLVEVELVAARGAAGPDPG